MPAAKYRISGDPPCPPLPNVRPQRSGIVIGSPLISVSAPRKRPSVRLNALIVPCSSLKLPTSKAPPNGPYPSGASASPQGDASGPPSVRRRTKVPQVLNTQTKPEPRSASSAAAQGTASVTYPLPS